MFCSREYQPTSRLNQQNEKYASENGYLNNHPKNKVIKKLQCGLSEVFPISNPMFDSTYDYYKLSGNKPYFYTNSFP